MYLLNVIDLVKERCIFYEDIINESDYLFNVPEKYDEIAVQKKWNKESVAHLKKLNTKFKSCEDFSKENLEQIFKEYLASENVGFGKVMPALRISITGKMQGPSMFSVMALLGHKDVLNRIDKSISTLGDG